MRNQRNERGTVYVIDEDESARTTLAALLESNSLSAKTFSSASEFLSHPKKKEDACILIEIRTPDVTTFDLHRKMASMGLKIPIIAISDCDSVIRQRASLVGAVSFFFRNPVNDRAVVDAVLWAINGAESRHEER